LEFKNRNLNKNKFKNRVKCGEKMRRIWEIEEVLKVNTEILVNNKFKLIFKCNKIRENQKINNIS
jgi:hypothetical protein